MNLHLFQQLLLLIIEHISFRQVEASSGKFYRTGNMSNRIPVVKTQDVLKQLETQTG
eukprot:CAMPEP_0184418272 /NCGR_PEP_ID=MMETSP0738-20130409/25388_1 /TAXON_ID=385413 /ORGANISM="Thalassiosira miniscula, Strain CCMP1093" /LENGTH=56 /DNA_ID=CAMNT_0026778333 /DNA_START=35 /DNA_END=205 /DNA_ORIENTATION=+